MRRSLPHSGSGSPTVLRAKRFRRLAQATDVVGTRTFAYNAALDEVSETVTGLYSKTLTRTYTTTGFKGKQQGLSIGNISHYTYGYDTYGRMNQITIPSGSFGYTRLANSDLVSQMTRPNGITTTWLYETDRDLITRVQNGTISTYGYVNDAIGRRTSMSRSGSAYSTSDIISYTYNDRSELTGAQSNVDTTYSYSYAYDPIGNRITANEAGVPWTYTTNNLNQYTSATENNTQLSFAYDLDGSMTYRPVDATSGWTQLWNGENRMVETYKGTDRLTFKYDYMGRRVEKCVYSGNTLTSKTLFVYDGFKCVEELDGLNGNAVTMRHAWQPFDVGLDVILATTDANGMSSFLHDANKSVMQKTAQNGILVDAYHYAPFGQSISNIIANLGFSSEWQNGDTLLSSYNFRDYIPYLGKWTNNDPISLAGGYNINSFLNNPIDYQDYLGLHHTTIERRNPEYATPKISPKFIQWLEFELWYLNEYEKIYDDDGNIKPDAWINKLKPCPYQLKKETYRSPKGESHSRFVTPKGWKKSPFFSFYGEKYHPGGWIELREEVSEDENGNRHGNQCIYNKCGTLLSSIGSAGTADWYSPGLLGDKLHNKHDVIPYNWAKSLDRIPDYYNVRPHIWFDPTGRKRINDVLFEIDL